LNDFISGSGLMGYGESIRLWSVEMRDSRLLGESAVSRFAIPTFIQG
jgi:hypothetical protein